MNRTVGRLMSTLAITVLLTSTLAWGAEVDSFDTLAAEYAGPVRTLMKRTCLECHSSQDKEGELDLEQFATLADVRRSTKIWLKVVEMIDNGEMPPKDGPALSPDERKQLRGWIDRYLRAEAYASAGDPGPVVLRRLSNSQYVYTLQDLTGVPINPAREFPVDGAAGEGFTNAGGALVMSPALLAKYFDAAKQVAAHAVLLPDGIRFSAATTRRDWTDESLAQIREIYRRYADPQDSTQVKLQGLVWESNDGGRIPLDKYFAATMRERDALVSGAKSPLVLAGESGLNSRYMETFVGLMLAKDPSALNDYIRTRWRTNRPEDAASVAADVVNWQKALTRFQSVGHMKSWMVDVNPLAPRQEFRVKLGPLAKDGEVRLVLAATDAGDGDENDFLIWRQPRLVAPGRPDLPLRDVRDYVREMTVRRQLILASAAKSLAAADEAARTSGMVDVAELAKKHDVDVDVLTPWLDYLGIGTNAAIKLDHFTTQLDKSGDYNFVRGWMSSNASSLMANSSDQHVRIPGNMKPHGVVVHPAPTLATAVGWQSPIMGRVRIEGAVTHAHPECGNGVTWSLELRRGNTRQVLAHGVAHGATPVAIAASEQAVQTGDLVSLVIGPRDANHSCDLTDLELKLASVDDAAKIWSLTADVSPDVLAANPHADRLGNAGVWHFYTEPVKAGDAQPTIPSGSLLARWQAATDAAEKHALAEQSQEMLTKDAPADDKNPDVILYRQLRSLGGPLLAAARARVSGTSQEVSGATVAADEVAWGPDPTIFGRHPNGSAIESTSLCVQAPHGLEIRLPAELVADAELAATAELDATTGEEGSVQPLILPTKPEVLTVMRPDGMVLVSDGSAARARIERGLAEFRRVFPAALCYSRIVPVDEVVTLTLFHREDEPLRRLMLDERETAQLDRLWHQLHFVSNDALTLVDAFAQLMEFATQDSNPALFEPFRKPIHDRADAFRRELVEAEPRQLDALVAFADRAYRRPLTSAERDEPKALYGKLRAQELPHEEALRLTLARIFVSPEFLYRPEKAAPGAAPRPVDDWELANRLSYFLWSSMPDAELREAAAAGRLSDPDVLASQVRRMLSDDRVRRLAVEFACQWLHVYDFDTLDEKSERHFPAFAELRGDMYEEVIRFFTDLAQHDRSVLEVYNADYTFVNARLAAHYGIQGVEGDAWRRVEGVGRYGRGGILGFAATLAKQSGASRTSPILRGNWVSEVLLGEKLPRPPKDVPRLPDDEAATEGLTVRQLVEKHTSDQRCAGCHVRIDPIGFALEAYDAIGGRREKDLAGRPIDVRSKLQDGAEFAGLEGLRNHLLTARREALLRQFCRKLLGYALGRGIQLSDEPLLEEMQARLAKNDYRFSVAVDAIVRSPQFREIRGADAHFAEATAEH